MRHTCKTILIRCQFVDADGDLVVVPEVVVDYLMSHKIKKSGDARTHYNHVLEGEPMQAIVAYSQKITGGES